MYAYGDEAVELTISAPNGTAVKRNNPTITNLLKLNGDITVSLTSNKQLLQDCRIDGGIVIEPANVYYDSNELKAYTTDGISPYTGTIVLGTSYNVEEYSFYLNDIRLHNKNFSQLMPASATIATNEYIELIDGTCNVLTLKDATINGTLKTMYNSCIRLEGNNQIIGKEVGLAVSGSTCIFGSGTLKVKADQIGIEMDGFLDVFSTNISIISQGYGIKGYKSAISGYVRLYNSTLTITATDRCVSHIMDFDLYDMAVVSPDNAEWKTDDSHIYTYMVGTDAVTGLMRFAPYYGGVSIGGTPVTAENAANVVPESGTLKSGTISYYPAGDENSPSPSRASCLVLDNVDYTGELGIEQKQVYLDIYVKGNNRIEATTGSALIQHNQYTTKISPMDAEQAESRLTLIAEDDAIICRGSTTYINEIKLDVTSKNGHGIVDTDAKKSNLYLEYTDLTLTAKKQLIDLKNIYLGYTSILKPNGAYVENGTIKDWASELPLENTTLHIAPQTTLSMGGIDLSDGGSNINVGQKEGTVSYDKDEHVLTLSNLDATLSEGLVIADTGYPLTIKVEGKNSITTTAGPAVDMSRLLGKSGDVRFDGNRTATLTLNGATAGVLNGKSSLYISRFKRLVIHGATSGIQGCRTSWGFDSSISITELNATISGGGTESAVKDVYWSMNDCVVYSSSTRFDNDLRYVYNAEDNTKAMVTDPIEVETYYRINIDKLINIDELTDPKGFVSSTITMEELIDAEGNLPAEYLVKGKAILDVENRVLTLDNAELVTPRLLIYYPDFTIRLIGENRLNTYYAQNKWNSIYALNNLNITGSGSLVIETVGPYEGRYILNCQGVLTVTNSNLTICYTSNKPYKAIWAGGGIKLDKSIVSRAALSYKGWTVEPPVLIANPVVNRTITDSEGNVATCVTIKGNTTDIEDISQPQNVARKVLQDGSIYIYRDGKWYDVLGRKLR